MLAFLYSFCVVIHICSLMMHYFSRDRGQGLAVPPTSRQRCRTVDILEDKIAKQHILNDTHIVDTHRRLGSCEVNPVLVVVVFTVTSVFENLKVASLVKMLKPNYVTF
jgi:hypothetical protein